MVIDKSIFNYILSHDNEAYADILGGETYPQIRGRAELFALPKGVLIITDVEGLPQTNSNIFAYHIHEGSECDNNFSKSGGHYNPNEMPHPMHAGDMSPLFAFNGETFSFFYTERVKLKDIIGRTLIIHDSPDDFTSQPSGNSGQKIACGVIQPAYTAMRKS